MIWSVSFFRLTVVFVVVGIASLSLASLRRWQRLLVVFVVGVSSLSSSRHHCHLVIIAVSSLAATVSLFVDNFVHLSTLKAYSILRLPCIQPPWSYNTKHRMVLLRYWVCGGCISSGCHPNFMDIHRLMTNISADVCRTLLRKSWYPLNATMNFLRIPSTHFPPFTTTSYDRPPNKK